MELLCSISLPQLLWHCIYMILAMKSGLSLILIPSTVVFIYMNLAMKSGLSATLFKVDFKVQYGKLKLWFVQPNEAQLSSYYI